MSGSVEAADVIVKAPASNPQVYEFNITPENFPFTPALPGRPQYITVKNIFNKGTSNLTEDKMPKLFIESVEVHFNDFNSALAN